MRISVCIPTYNQSQYLKQAIESAYHQTMQPCEIIVSNDCSTDDTKKILIQLSNEISILKVINQPNNLGIASNTNCCLKHATGDFIVRLDSDDYLSANYCEKLVELLIAYPNAGYAHCNIQQVDQFGELYTKRILFRNNVFQDSAKALIASIKGYQVAANIVMFRRLALVEVGYINNRPDFGEDYHLSVDLAANGWGNVFSKETLSYYRIWIDKGQLRSRRKLAEINGYTCIFKELLIPYFKNDLLQIKNINSQRRKLAIRHSSCLSWNIYSKYEKEQIAISLMKLSNNNLSKLFIWMYTHKLSMLPNTYFFLYDTFKSYAKQILLKFIK